MAPVFSPRLSRRRRAAASSRPAIFDRLRGGAGWFTEPVMAGDVAGGSPSWQIEGVDGRREVEVVPDV